MDVKTIRLPPLVFLNTVVYLPFPSFFTRKDGWLGLYRGFGISCCCIFVYRGLYFGLFDSLKPLLLTENSSWLQTFLLGWAVTVTSG